LNLTRGILSQCDWGKFQIDEEGAAALQKKTLPGDLRSHIEKAIAAMWKQYRIAKPVVQETEAW